MLRFWFEFDLVNYSDPPMAIGYGCGVTAISRGDAISILQKEVFVDRVIAPIKKCIENINVSALDVGHVLPNMLPPNRRGYGSR